LPFKPEVTHDTGDGFGILLVPLFACGDSGPTAPAAPRFPALNGVWDLSGNIQQIPGATISGTISTTQNSRDIGVFGGQFTATFQFGTEVFGVTGPITDGSVTEAGGISFNVEHSSYRHTAQLQGGNTMAGTWMLIGSTNYSGSFTALKR
jgi:hypothetical protein